MTSRTRESKLTWKKRREQFLCAREVRSTELLCVNVFWRCTPKAFRLDSVFCYPHDIWPCFFVGRINYGMFYLGKQRFFFLVFFFYTFVLFTPVLLMYITFLRIVKREGTLPRLQQECYQCSRICKMFGYAKKLNMTSWIRNTKSMTFRNRICKWMWIFALPSPHPAISKGNSAMIPKHIFFKIRIIWSWRFVVK